MRARACAHACAFRVSVVRMGAQPVRASSHFCTRAPHTRACPCPVARAHARAQRHASACAARPHLLGLGDVSEIRAGCALARGRQVRPPDLARGARPARERRARRACCERGGEPHSAAGASPAGHAARRLAPAPPRAGTPEWRATPPSSPQHTRPRAHARDHTPIRTHPPARPHARPQAGHHTARSCCPASPPRSLQRDLSRSGNAPYQNALDFPRARVRAPNTDQARP